MISLPEVNIPADIKRGRSIRDGYQRGWGLTRNLSAELDKDPHFQECFSLAKDRTVVSPMRIKNLYLLIRFYLPKLLSGDIIEFGSYRGGSALFMAAAAKIFLPQSTVYALDTFEGMPSVDANADIHRAGDFRDTSYDDLIRVRNQNNLSNLVPIKGLFQDTAPDILNGKRIALAHIDCDIKTAVAYSYDIVKPHMVRGSYYVFDDSTTPSCLGATEAVEEFVIKRDGKFSEQIYPHHVFREGLGDAEARSSL